MILPEPWLAPAHSAACRSYPKLVIPAARVPFYPTSIWVGAMKTTLERAFELARSGRFEKVRDLQRALSAEGFTVQQVSGPTLFDQLRKLMKEAKVREVE